jgi:NAD(P)H-hydrate repair Nnr-like enzyme with NAD(P)H-hydrate epimerase domain
MAIDIPSGLSTDKRARQTIRGDWLKEIFNDLRKVGADVWRVNLKPTINWAFKQPI